VSKPIRNGIMARIYSTGVYRGGRVNCLNLLLTELWRQTPLIPSLTMLDSRFFKPFVFNYIMVRTFILRRYDPPRLASAGKRKLETEVW
jgi:hypothetical protein